MGELLTSLSGKFPIIISVMAIMLSFKVSVEAIMDLFKLVTKATPTKKDDEIYNKVESSKIYVGLLKILKYLTSIEIKK